MIITCSMRKACPKSTDTFQKSRYKICNDFQREDYCSLLNISQSLYNVLHVLDRPLFRLMLAQSSSRALFHTFLNVSKPSIQRPKSYFALRGNYRVYLKNNYNLLFGQLFLFVSQIVVQFARSIIHESCAPGPRWNSEQVHFLQKP